MPARNIGNLRIVHQPDKILLHFSRKEILIGQDEKDLPCKRCKVCLCHRLLIHEVGKQPGDMRIFFLLVIFENGLKHIPCAGDLFLAFIADMR